MYTSKSQLPIALGLAALMLATRFHHPSWPLILPDASWAVFFLAGFYLRLWLIFPLFIAAAGLADYGAVQQGESDWCVTPAYLFLVPAYACLWLAGRWYASRNAYYITWRSLLPLGGALLAGASAAFLISNGSFYLYSGYFTDLGWAEYAVHTAVYFPPYLGSTFIYVVLVAWMHVLASALGPERGTGVISGTRALG